MKAYIYKPTDIGQPHWNCGDNGLRLDVTSVAPDQADVFIVTGVLRGFPDAQSIRRLPYFEGNEARHVFFDIVEEYVVYDLPSMFIRCTLHDSNDRDVNSIAWPWPVENYQECIQVPEGGFLYDVSFHGWLSQVIPTRMESTESCLDGRYNLNCDFARYPDFTGAIYDTAEGIRRRATYRQSMQQSRLCLCPESLSGDFPYRFFEAMSAGRMPVLVGSGEVFPFADEIPYCDFMLHVPRQDAPATGQHIREFLSRTCDHEIIERGKLARYFWEKYLDREKWVGLMTYAAEMTLRRQGLLEPLRCDDCNAEFTMVEALWSHACQ